MMWRTTKPKLPPQPAPTALARLMRRLVDLLPGATIGTRNAMREANRSLMQQIGQAQTENHSLLTALRELRADFGRFMAPVPRPYGRSKGRIEDQVWQAAPVLRMEIRYEPMSFAMAMTPQEYQRAKHGRLSPHTIEALREAARTIARKQARHHEAEILRATLKSLNIDDSDHE